MALYSLTDLSGRRSSAGRTAVVATIELPRRLWLIIGISAVPGLMLGLIFSAIFGTYGIAALPATVGIAVWLFYTNSSEGLGLPTWRTLLDKRLAVRGNKGPKLGEFAICGVPFRPGEVYRRQVTTSTTPYEPEPFDESELIGV